jgi:hypothetical protein
VRCDTTKNNSPRLEFEGEKSLDLPEEQIDEWQKVTGQDPLGVVLEEC